MKEKINYNIIDKGSMETLLKKKHKRYGKFTVDIEHMEDSKARKFETDLNKYYASCGCNTGNYFLVAALVLFVVHFYITGQTIYNWKIIVQGFIILSIAAVLGKFLGKIIDNFKFKKTIKNLSLEL
ncbi:MAG: hypothetical protein O6943_02240 [Bacteroidetes bacterium]|nr:hypothetical protein [Bacteroidota bacterium]